MKRTQRMLALLMMLALIISVMLPVSALAASGTDSPVFAVHVSRPEGFADRTELDVLTGTIVQLTATYEDKAQAPQGTQFCWQYSTAGAADSYKYLTPSPTDISHISTNAVQFMASEGATWYRTVLETEAHEPAEDYRPNISTAVVITGKDFLFTEPVSDPAPAAALPGATLTLGPVKAETVRDATISYQWQQASGEEWTDLPGATAPALTTGPLEAGTWQFRCQARAASGAGSADTAAITSPVYTVEVEPLALTGYRAEVNGIPAQVSESGALSADAGSTAALAVQLSDESVQPAYQWQTAPAGGAWRDLTASDGVWGTHASRLCIPVTAQNNGQRYRCQVSGTGMVLGTGPDDPVVMITVPDPGSPYADITPSPFITSLPAASGTELTVPPGMPVRMTANSQTTPEIPPEYLRWQWETAAQAGGPFAPLSGASGSECILRADPDLPQFVRCRVVNAASGDTLEAVSNTICVRAAEPDGSVFFTEPVSAPQPVQVHPGDSWTFACRAQSDDGSPVAYAWQYAAVSAGTAAADVPESAWITIPDTDSSVYTAEDLRAGSYFYRCLAANRADADKQAVSSAWAVAVVPYSTTPVVSPPATVPGPQGTSVPNAIPVGIAAGGSTVFAVEASVPAGDRVEYTWYREPLGPGQEPELMDDEHGSTLELNDVPAMYDACRFYCIVNNRSHRNEQTHSAAWYLSVWQPSQQPEILSQPQSITAAYDPADPGDGLSVRISARRSTDVVLEKQQPDGSWALSDNFALKKVTADGTEESGSASQTYDGVLPLASGQPDLNGTYRLRVDNGALPAPLLPPCVYSDLFEISVRVSGQPLITEQPAPASAAVGSTASFALTAEATTDSPLVYCWQLSTDGGFTYRDCLPEDGTAAEASFTTAVLTEDMQGREPQLWYRCLVANSDTGQYAVSWPAVLTVVAGPAPPPITGDPEISVRPGSGLTVRGGMLEGLVARREGTKASVLLDSLTAPDGYHLQLTAEDGTPLSADDLVTTGTAAELVRDADEQEVPAVLTVVVQGDVIGNGQLSVAQLSTLAKALIRQIQLDGAYLRAGDFNGSGSIDVSDLVSEARLLTQPNRGR